jgi:hypothetical protein
MQRRLFYLSRERESNFTARLSAAAADVCYAIMQQRHLLQTEKVAGQMKLLYPTEKWLCNQFKWICDERLIARAVQLLMLL